MPPDGTLQVGTQVNLANLRAGMAEAQAAVKQASENMAAAQLQFGRAAEQGNTQAAAALKLYQVELQSAQSAVQALTGTEERETVALRSNISARMAASSELRVLEGNLLGSTRAAAAFLTAIPGIGAALQVAFPLFGALALIEVLVTMGEKVAKLADDFDGLRKISDEAFADMAKAEQEAIGITEEHLRITRGLNVARAELASAKTGRSAAGAAAGDAFDISVATNNLKTLQGQIEATKQTYDDLLTRSKATTTQFSPLGGVFGGPAGGVSTQPTDDAKVAATQLGKVYEDLSNQEGRAQNLRDQITEKQTEMTLRQREGQEELGRASEEAARKWQTLLSQVQKSSEEVARTTREISNQQIEYWSRLKQESDLANDPSSIQLIGKESRDQLDVLKQQTDQYRHQADAKIKAASETYRGVEQRTQTQVQTGTLSPGQRIAILQQAADKEYAVQFDAIQKKEALDAGYTAKYQLDRDQETAITQAYYQKQQQLALQGTQQQQHVYQQMFSTIDASFTRAMDTWLEGTDRMNREWRQFGENIAISVINGLARAAAAEVLSLATSNAINAEKRLDDAKTAAANSYTWASAWGGPIAGAISAAIAFAAVASFDQGTSLVPRDGMAMLHKGEAVLPPPQTAVLAAALSGRGGSDSGQASQGIRDINFSPTYQTSGNTGKASLRDFAKVLRSANLLT